MRCPAGYSLLAFLALFLGAIGVERWQLPQGGHGETESGLQESTLTAAQVSAGGSVSLLPKGMGPDGGLVPVWVSQGLGLVIASQAQPAIPPVTHAHVLTSIRLGSARGPRAPCII